MVPLLRGVSGGNNRSPFLPFFSFFPSRLAFCALLLRRPWRLAGIWGREKVSVVVGTEASILRHSAMLSFDGNRLKLALTLLQTPLQLQMHVGDTTILLFLLLREPIGRGSAVRDCDFHTAPRHHRRNA